MNNLLNISAVVRILFGGVLLDIGCVGDHVVGDSSAEKCKCHSENHKVLLCTSKEVNLGVNVEKMLSVMSVDVL